MALIAADAFLFLKCYSKLAALALALGSYYGAIVRRSMHSIISLSRCSKLAECIWMLSMFWDFRARKQTTSLAVLLPLKLS